MTLLETNACSPLATNAMAGNIWDNFSSQSYKELPSVGEITWYHPYTGEPQHLHDAGRRPRLHAAAVAHQPLVDGAVPAEQHASAASSRARRSRRGCASFDDSHRADAVARAARQGLAARRQDSRRDRPRRRPRAGRLHGEPAYVTCRRATCPTSCSRRSARRSAVPGALHRRRHRHRSDSDQGTPIGLLANLNLLSEDRDPVQRARHAERGRRAGGEGPRATCTASAATPPSEQARAAFKDLVDPLLELSKCPDLDRQPRPSVRHRRCRTRTSAP